MDFELLNDNDGQELVSQIKLLSKQDRIPHAVIIDGGNDIKRRELATFISMSALCLAPSEQKPCMQCSSCKKVLNDSHSGIYTAKDKDAKSQTITAQEVRNIIRLANIIPNECKYNTFHFYNADKRLSVICQNALLKIIEEPPESAIFIFTCEKARSLLETIRSRATLFTLGATSENDDDALSLAREIALGIIDINEMKLLIATSKLTDKVLAARVLNFTALILRDALALFLGAEADFDEQTAQKLRRKLTRDKLLKLITVTNDCIYKFNQNANTALLTTWLCSNYRRISWQK